MNINRQDSKEKNHVRSNIVVLKRSLNFKDSKCQFKYAQYCLEDRVAIVVLFNHFSPFPLPFLYVLLCHERQVEEQVS